MIKASKPGSSGSANVDTATIQLPGNYVAGDTALVFINLNAANSFSFRTISQNVANSGWTEVVNEQQDPTLAVYRKRLTVNSTDATPEPAFVADFDGTDQASWGAIIVPGVIASDPVIASASTNAGSSSSHVSQTVSVPESDNGALVLWVEGINGNGKSIAMPDQATVSAFAVGGTASGDQATGLTVSAAYLPASGGTTPQLSYYHPNRTSNSIVLALALEAGEERTVSDAACCEFLAPFDINNFSGQVPLTEVDVSADLSTKINSITAINATTGEDIPFGENQIGGTYLNDATSDVIQCRGFEFDDGPYAYDGELLGVHLTQQELNALDSMKSAAQIGVILGFWSGASGSRKIRAWAVSGNDTKPNVSVRHFVALALNNTTHAILDESGFDPDDLRGVILGVHQSNRSRVVFSNLVRLQKIREAGGSAKWPVNMAAIQRRAKGANLFTILDQNSLALSQFSAMQGFRLGSTTVDSYIDLEGENVEFGGEKSASIPQQVLNADADTFEIEYGCTSGTTTKLGNAIFTSRTRWKFTVLAGSATDSSPDFSGRIFENCLASYRNLGPRAFAEMTLLNSPEATKNDADLTDAIFDGCTTDQQFTITEATEEAAQAELDDFTRVIFRGSSLYGLKIVNSGSDDWALSFDGQKIDSLRYECTGGDSTLTASRLNGAVISSASASSGDAVNVIAPIKISLNGINGQPYRVYNVTDSELVEAGTASSDAQEIAFSLTGKTLSIVVGDDQSIRSTSSVVTGASDIPVFPTATPDGFRLLDDATALAISGITMVGDTSVAITDAVTIQHLYEYLMATSNELANLQYVQPISTSDGVTFILNPAYTWTVNGGSLTGLADLLSGTITVLNDGFIETAAGATWENGGSTYYASHFYVNGKNDADSSAIESAVCAFFENDGGTEVTFATDLTPGAVLTDSNGDAEGYCVYRINSTTYSGLTQILGEYSFGWSRIPVNASGAPLSQNIRLFADANKTLSKANALAVSGITVDHSTKVADLSAETNSAAYDNLKARQARIADIESGKPGYQSFYEVGLIISYDGSLFSALSDWKYQNLGGTGTWKGGTVQLGTPGNLDLDFDTVTIEYTAAGTYDHRNEISSGTITLTNTSGDDVTAQFDVDVSITNDGPDITLQQTLAITVNMPNALDGSIVRLYNDTQDAELFREEVSGGSGSSTGITYGEGQELAPGDDVTWTCLKSSGSTHYLPIVETQTATGGNMSFTTVQELDTEANDVMSAEGWTGEALDKGLNPTTGEILADFANIQIDVNDPDDRLDVRKGVIWFNYRCATQDGIQIYNPKALARKPDIRNIEVDGPILIDNRGDTLYAFGGVWKRKDGNPIIAAGSNTIHWVPDDRVYQPPIIETVSGTTAETLLAAIAGLSTLSAADIAEALETYDAPTKDELDTALEPLALASSIASVIADLSSVKAKTDALSIASGRVAASVNGEQGNDNITRAEVEAILLSLVAGLTEGAGTGTEVFLNRAGNKPRGTFGIDANGNRVSAVLDGT